jgi:quercetin dioxygenase-like cupin family protein
MRFVHAHEGQSLRVLRDTVNVKLPSAASSNRLAVVVVDVPPESFVPLVSHRDEEECYYVLEGRLRVTLGREERELAPGDLVHIPPRTPHAYRNASADTVRFLAFTVGGPIDGFFAELAERVQEMPRDAAAMAQAMARFGVVPEAGRGD